MSEPVHSNLLCVCHVVGIFVVFVVVVVAVVVVVGGGGGAVFWIYRDALLEVLEGFQMVVVIFFIWWGWRSPSCNYRRSGGIGICTCTCADRRAAATGSGKTSRCSPLPIERRPESLK